MRGRFAEIMTTKYMSAALDQQLDIGPLFSDASFPCPT